MPFTIIRQDITKMRVDAIVNAANTDLVMGGGVCGAIFQAAGAYALQAACDKIAPIKTGEAALTPAFALPCRYVIHAAGPVYRAQDAAQSEALLRSAYTSALELAAANHCNSIAFPLISSGIYGYPKAEALRVATAAIEAYLSDHDIHVYLTVFDKASFCIGEKLQGDVECYLDEHYAQTQDACQHDPLAVTFDAPLMENRVGYSAPAPVLGSANAASAPAEGVAEALGKLDEPFSAALLRLIDAKGKTDVEVYKRANLDRKLFSKIRAGKGYMPSKRTALALAVALELTLAETDDLLERAGFALSHSQKFDVILEYFIVNARFNIFEINEVLFSYDQPLLGG